MRVAISLSDPYLTPPKPPKYRLFSSVGAFNNVAGYAERSKEEGSKVCGVRMNSKNFVALWPLKPMDVIRSDGSGSTKFKYIEIAHDGHFNNCRCLELHSGGRAHVTFFPEWDEAKPFDEVELELGELTCSIAFETVCTDDWDAPRRAHATFLHITDPTSNIDIEAFKRKSFLMRTGNQMEAVGEQTKDYRSPRSVKGCIRNWSDPTQMSAFVATDAVEAWKKAKEESSGVSSS